MARNIYSVTDITAYIKRLISQDFMCSAVSVEGELSNVKYHSSGHIYFTLKDAGAALSCIMFASDARALSFRLTDGQKIVAGGRISVYEAAGRYQLYVTRAQKSGLGELYIEYERIKKELEEQGMFDPEYKRPLPVFAKRIGVVTSPTGAVRRDIERNARRRNPYIEIVLYPAKVQGIGAEESIVRGIENIAAYEPDVIIVARGGGSIEDLWAFNSPMVAQAIFDSEIPIISAVGHETDTTIADLVADVRASTPTAAAELCVCELSRVFSDIEDKKQALVRLMNGRLSGSRLMVRERQARMKSLSPQMLIMKKKSAVERIADDLEFEMKRRLSNAADDLTREKTDLKAAMDGRLKALRISLDEYNERMNSNAKGRLSREAGRLDVMTARLDSLSPLKRLAGGYAYVENADKKHVNSIKDVNTGDDIRMFLRDGYIAAVVKDVLEEPSDL